MEEDTSLDLTVYAGQVNRALADGTPCLLATAGPDGQPDIGLKGSLMVFDHDHLAYLERTHRLHLENLRQNPRVAVMYFNRQAEYPQLRFYGVAELLESGPVRDEIRNRTVAPELARDPEHRGIGVLIRVDRVVEPKRTLVRAGAGD